MEPRIRVLEPEVAKRIAAGEVIDRPAAALRELLDNAIDSGASSVSVELSGGGIDELRVVDDGSGMGRDDLALSILPHATSKIRELDDLLSLSTLGFRGEALASMAAVARVDIVSATSDGEAWRLESEPGKEATIRPCSGIKGSSVTIRDLFASFPARKRFLKRASAEAAVCRATFVDKAVAFPTVSFSLSSGGKPLLRLRPSSLSERVLSALDPDLPPELFRELVASGPGFKARIVAGLPAVYRGDRRHILVFVNGRRVQEYGIAQALEYGYRGALPGGAWPYAYAFVEVDPDRADFNIHPAKKEVRLRNLDDIRTGIIGSLRDYLGNHARRSLAPSLGQGFAPSPLPTDSSALAKGDPVSKPVSLFDPRDDHAPRGDYASDSGSRFASGYAAERNEASTWAAIAEAAALARERGGASPWRTEPARALVGPGEASPGESSPGEAGTAPDGFRYLGRALGVFLIFERGEELFLLDQHAAHERVLYDELMSGRVASQELLVPVVYEAESDEEDAYLEGAAEALAAAGFRLEREGGSWVLSAAPAMLPESQTGSVFSLLRARPEPEDLVRATAAQAACKAAVKDGDDLGEAGARALIRAALALPEPRCPHGRPIWTVLSREALFRAVRRIV